MKPFYINLGIKIGHTTYRIALLNLYYAGIENTLLWSNGWKKLKWKIYTNVIDMNVGEKEEKVCEVHGDHHKFIECDELSRTCICGETE